MNQALESALAKFEQQHGELLIGGIPISQIVEEHGTPLYIYDKQILKWRHRILRQALPNDLKIYYAVKANPNLEIIRELANLYDGSDIASKGEMLKAIEAGVAPEKMSFAGPGKNIDDLYFAIEQGIATISVESEREIDHIKAICRELQKEARILIRVNPDFELASSGMKMGGGPKQFGIDSERVPETIRKLQGDEWVKLEGIHIFAGSQNLRAQAILEAFSKIFDYCENLSAEVDVRLKTVNLGGGFGIPYFAHDSELDVETVAKGLQQLLANYRNRLIGTQFRIELGRYIVGECGLYVAKILYRKVSRGQVFLIIDGGLHHHLAASGNFGQSVVRRPFPITVVNRLNNPLEKVNVVGPLCTPLDTFGMQVLLPKTAEGDLITVMSSGAYGYSASPIAFLSHQPPKEIVL